MFFQETLRAYTTCSAIIVDFLKRKFAERPDVGVACVYCEYKQQDQQTALNLVASIWRQLCQYKHTLPEAAKALYNDHMESRARLSLANVEAITLEAIDSYSRVLLVTDALDECTEEGLTRSKFMSTLRTLLSGDPSSENKLQVMITSRQIGSLVEAGDDIEIYATEDDLRKVVKRSITDGISRSPTLADTIRSNRSLAGGSFRSFVYPFEVILWIINPEKCLLYQRLSESGNADSKIYYR